MTEHTATWRQPRFQASHSRGCGASRPVCISVRSTLAAISFLPAQRPYAERSTNDGSNEYRAAVDQRVDEVEHGRSPVYMTIASYFFARTKSVRNCPYHKSVLRT